MKQKCLHNHSLQEGVFFLLMGGALLRYGLDSHSKSFNKDWTQSAYLFPVIVALLLCALAVIRMPYLAATVFSLTLTLSTFEVATFAFLLVLMLYLGVRSRKVLLTVPLATTVFLSVMFRTLLRVLLP